MAVRWDCETFRPVLGYKLLAFLVVFRVFNALVVRTSFTPDEFWQGPEPAHLLTFGTGHLTWEWEPSARIRGFTHPLVFAAVYKALRMMGLDTRWAIAHSPKLLQGAMAGVCDYYTFGLAFRVFGRVVAGWTLLFQVLSWFNFYCLVRPYSNSAEAVLATAALFHWAPHFLMVAATEDGTARNCLAPKRVGKGKGGGRGARDEDDEHLGGTDDDDRGSGPEGVPSPSSSRSASYGGETCALLLAALCVAVRPTSAALWVAVGFLRLSTLPILRWPRYLSLTVLPPVAAVVGASFYLDSLLYGSPTLVPWNFLRFNVLEGKSRIFGEQAWHWNFSQGLPAVLGAALPAAFWGFWGPSDGIRREKQRLVGSRRRWLGWLAVWFLVYHSTSPHKEFRFLLPVLPIAHAYAGQAVVALIASAGRASSSSSSSSIESPNLATAQGRRRQRRLGNVIAIAIFVLHVPAAVYLSVWHQSGALSAVDTVARMVPNIVSSKIAATGDDAPGWAGQTPREPPPLVSVHFLMPCHSAPLHSHLHFKGSEGGSWSGNASLWSLDCSPRNRALPGGSESDKFQADPLAFLESTYGRLPRPIPAEAQANQEHASVTTSPPDLAVIYDTHLSRPGVPEFLSDRLGLQTVEVLFNAHVNGDADSDDTHRNVYVLARGFCSGGGGGEGGKAMWETNRICQL